MNLVRLSFAYLKSQPLTNVLNLSLLTLGVASITLLLLITHQLEQRLAQEAQGIDLVVGAKGSPLQIILAGVYHVDVPSGNIPLAEVNKLRVHPLIKQVIPLALGDSYRGYRIVGTEHAYVENYQGQLAQGRLWQKPLEAVIGSAVARRLGLAVGATFSGAHGIAETGAEHTDNPYTVVGVLQASNTILDRLVLTSVESVWLAHDEADAEEKKSEQEREVTVALLQYRSPLAAASLPRLINSQTVLQAASPAQETARLMAVFGLGVEIIRGFAALLIVAAGLSIFVALYQALQERKYDIAIMRSLGASRGKVFGLLLFEGVLLAAAGAVLGLALGHVLTESLAYLLTTAQQEFITGRLWLLEELLLFALALMVGILAALIPAWRAYGLPVATTLARG